ncbi:MAG: phage holin family protein [Solirubrobacteraceae bacterium]
MAAEPPPTQQNIAQAITEVSERASLLIREEIELAKAEITEKVTTLIKGAVVGIAAGIFVVVALLFVLHGFAWLVTFKLFSGTADYYWGFFVVAAILLLLGALAGYFAARAVKAGGSPVPSMAIGEARKIKDAVSAGGDRS